LVNRAQNRHLGPGRKRGERPKIDEGCIIISTGTCVFSTPMTEAEIDTLVAAFKSGFAKLASMG
jgi:hypothetical protein